MNLFSAECRGPRGGLLRHLAPADGRRSRRTATLVTASLLLSIAGPALTGQDLVSAAQAQTPPATAEPAKTDPPAAQPSPEEVAAARNHFESGVDFFQRGNYSAARAEFEAAYQLTKYPQLLFNLGKTAEKLNQDADAIRYLDAYLAASPNASDAAEVRTKLAELRLRTPAVVVPTTPPPPPVGKRPPIPALALLGGGAAFLIIGIGCGAGALSDSNSLQTTEPQPIGPARDTMSRGQALNTTAITFDVIGGLALAAGGAWTGYWLYQRHKANQLSTPGTPTAPAVSLIPMGLGIGIAGRF